MHMKEENVTPAMAEKYLSTNLEKQRHIQKSKVDLFAGMMSAGTFNGLNGETIKFSVNVKAKSHVLIDGQHRLAAIVSSGKPQKLLIIRGLPSDAFITLDQGTIRTVEHYYQIAGKANPKVCSQVAKWLYYSEYGRTPLSWRGKGAAPIPGLVAQWGLEKYPDIPDVVGHINDYLCQFQRKGLGTKNHLAYCYYLWQKNDEHLAYDIARFLASGEGSVPQTIHSLREWLMQEGRADKDRALPGSKRGAKVINALNTAWNAVQDGKKNIKMFARLVSKFEKDLGRITQGCDAIPATVDV